MFLIFLCGCAYTVSEADGEWKISWEERKEVKSDRQTFFDIVWGENFKGRYEQDKRFRDLEKEIRTLFSKEELSFQKPQIFSMLKVKRK